MSRIFTSAMCVDQVAHATRSSLATSGGTPGFTSTGSQASAVAPSSAAQAARAILGVWVGCW